MGISIIFFIFFGVEEDVMLKIFNILINEGESSGENWFFFCKYIFCFISFCILILINIDIIILNVFNKRYFVRCLM